MSRAVVGFLLLAFVCTQLLSVTESSHCKAWLVQSIPTDMPHLSSVPGVLATGDVLKWMAMNSSHKLDIIAQYWQLNASPNDRRSSDYGYSESQIKAFGVDDL